MNINFLRGSEWRKWDLHVHTPESILNNQFGNDWDTYVYQLFTKAISKGIAVIGITDYFTIEGYKKIKQDYIANDDKLKQLFKRELEIDNNYLEKIKQILLLPNIEFRLDKVLSSRRDGEQPRRLNYHIIFSDTVSINDIEENFLHNLEFTYQGDPIFGFDRRKLKIHNLRLLGKKLKEEHGFFKNMSELEVGCMNAVVNLEQVCEILKNKNNNLFNGNYLMIFVEEYTNLIDWDSQDHNIRKTILSVSDMIFSSNKKTRDWALTEEFKKEFSSLKPCIWGSDAHCFDKMFNPDRERFCWIKADPTFEGLKQVINEPKDRVFIGKKPPKLELIENNKSYYIDKIRIKKIDGIEENLGWFDSEIVFNKDLVTIIGNKGSGKSALADIIGLIGNSKNEKHFSFLSEDRFKRKPENLADKFEAEITWYDGKTIKKKLSESRDSANIERVKYLPQQYIEKTCNELGSEFQNEINKMVFSYLSEDQKLGKSTFDDLINYKCQSIQDQIDSKIKELHEINKKIIKLENKQKIQFINELKNTIKFKLDEYKSHIKNKPKKIELPETKDTSIEEEKIVELEVEINKCDSVIQEKITELNSLNIDVSKLEIIESKISELKNFYNKINKEIKEIIEERNFRLDYILELKCDTKRITEKIKEYKEKIDNLNIELEQDKDKQTKDSLFYKKELLLKEKNRLIEKLDSTRRKYQLYLDNLRQWKERKKELMGNENKQGTLKWYAKELRFIRYELPKQLNEALAKRKEIVSKIFDLKIEKVNKYKDIYKPVMEHINNLKNIAILIKKN